MLTVLYRLGFNRHHFLFKLGGSGRRKLTLILQATDGYTAQALKSVSNIYLPPLQEEPSTEPLPFNAPEFAKMPKANCMNCGCLLPLQMLTNHREGCTVM